MRFSVLFLSVSLLGAQSVSSPDFDALSKRAAAALNTDPKQAVQLYRKALAKRPEWAEGWFDLGASLYETSRFRESKDAFLKAGALAPQNGAVWGFLGLCEDRLGETSQALADIRHAEAVGLPDDPRFIANIRNCAALICIHSRRFSEAVEQLRPLTKTGNQSQSTIEALGASALALPYAPGEIPPAKRALINQAGRAMAALFSERGDPRDLFQKLVADHGTEPGVHYLAGVYWLEPDPQKARQEFEKELAISPSNVPARLQIAILDIKAGDAHTALQLGTQAVKLEPDNALAHTVIARAYEHTGEYAKAIPQLETAIRLAPENPQLHFSLSQAYTHVGKTAEAAKQIAEFQRLKGAQGAQ